MARLRSSGVRRGTDSLTGLLNRSAFDDKLARELEELEIETETGERIAVTASFGAASFPTHASAASLVAAADRALYEAKR